MSETAIISGVVIALGGGRLPTGEIGPESVARAERAVELATQQGYRILFSGNTATGTMCDVDLTEAGQMMQVALSKGFPMHLAGVETTSTSSFENLLHSSELLSEDDRSVTVVTGRYAEKRVSYLASRILTNNNVTVVGVEAPLAHPRIEMTKEGVLFALTKLCFGRVDAGRQPDLIAANERYKRLVSLPKRVVAGPVTRVLSRSAKSR